MATKIIKEIDSYMTQNIILKIGIIFFFFNNIYFFLFKNINNNDSIPFVATFNYVEGINNDTEVQIAGIKIGDVNKITFLLMDYY